MAPDPSNGAGENYVLEVGQSETQGLELDIRGRITKNFNLVANYALTNSEITKATTGFAEGSKIAGYAKHNANAWLTYSILSGDLRGLGLSTGLSYQADRTTWNWDAGQGKDPLPNYFRLDAGAFWTVGKMKFNANVYNVLNKYLYSGSYYGYGQYYYWQTEAPRNYRLSVAYKF